MAGDNTFERQMLDFYGDNIDTHLFTFFKDRLISDNKKFKATYTFLTFLLALKEHGFMFSDIQADCHKMQHELYNQLEVDRQNVNR